NWELIPIALAPILGHAFSPFLRFKGGKAVAVTLGIWSVLLPVEGIIGLGLSMFIFFIFQNVDSWTVILGILLFFVYLLFRQVSIVILLIWFGNTLILIYKHRQDLKRPITLKSWIMKLLRTN
ncbi:MAG: glycerol-3-phosphate acyltransferase, partial [Candidatus Marinimicrobia bacterium]|nr:glycerol-3-phosphate acyltransferase [Candidatus Neomarinimicrobiota bacterium]